MLLAFFINAQANKCAQGTERFNDETCAADGAGEQAQQREWTSAAEQRNEPSGGKHAYERSNDHRGAGKLSKGSGWLSKEGKIVEGQRGTTVWAHGSEKISVEKRACKHSGSSLPAQRNRETEWMYGAAIRSKMTNSLELGKGSFVYRNCDLLCMINDFWSVFHEITSLTWRFIWLRYI